MTYAEEKYLTLAALMTDMSEDLIHESDIRTGAVRPEKVRRTGRFSAFLNHPAMVAVLCAVVSLSVVAAIVLAGRGGTYTPPAGDTLFEDVSHAYVYLTAYEGDSMTHRFVPEGFAVNSEGSGYIAEGMGFRGRDEQIITLDRIYDRDTFELHLRAGCEFQGIRIYDAKMNVVAQDTVPSLDVPLKRGTYYVTLSIKITHSSGTTGMEYVFALFLSEATEGLNLQLIEETSEEGAETELIPADFASYESIIRMYRKIVEVLPDFYSPDGDSNPSVDGLFSFPDEQAKEWYRRVGEAAFILCPGDRVNGHAHFGYAIKDVNGDGVEELFLLTEEYTLLALFTQRNGKPALLDDYWQRKKGFVNDDGRIMIAGSSGADRIDQEIYHIDAATGQLVFEEAIGLDGHTEDLETIYYHQIGEQKAYISEEAYNALRNGEPYASIDYTGFGVEKNRAVLGEAYTPVCTPCELRVASVVGGTFFYERIYTDPQKIAAFADFFTELFAGTDPIEVPNPSLNGHAYLITLAYENGAICTYNDSGAYMARDGQWYQIDEAHMGVIRALVELYESDVEILADELYILAVDETGIYGTFAETGRSVYVKGFDGTAFDLFDTVRIEYGADQLKEDEGTVVNGRGESVAYQWVIEEPLSVWTVRS